MATRTTKTTRTSKAANAAPSTSSGDTAFEQKVVQLAEQLGRIAGTMKAKTEGWLDPQTLSAQLTSIRDSAADLLSQVTGQEPAAEPPRADKPARGPVDAPGKRHRKAPPSVRAGKHVADRVTTMREANNRRRGRG